MAKKRFGLKLWPFPCEFRARPYVFGIRKARRMGLDRVLIQIQTFKFFAPPLIVMLPPFIILILLLAYSYPDLLSFLVCYMSKIY